MTKRTKNSGDAPKNRNPLLDNVLPPSTGINGEKHRGRRSPRGKKGNDPRQTNS